MIVGLSVAHLLQGVAHIVQRPTRYRVYWVHLLWVFFLFVYLLHFWWWEFSLAKLEEWNFLTYCFIAIYAVLLYLLCTLVIPETIDEWDGFRGYFYFRRQWIFALMAVLFVVDIADTVLKGYAHYQRLGLAYALRIGVFLGLCLIATKVKRPMFHAVFAVFAVVYEVAYILYLYGASGQAGYPRSH
jgi:hypothetical protein